MATTTVRASAALPASGVYDTLASARAVPVAGARSLTLLCDYTRGGTGGAFKLEVWLSRDGTNFYPRTYEDPASASTGSLNVNTEQDKFEAAPGASDQPLSFTVRNLEDFAAVKVLAAEYGNTGAPGTLAIVGALGA